MAPPSKPIAAHLLVRDRQVVTRYQEQRIRSTFPFLRLPPELRNIIYELCFSFKGIETFYDRVFSKLEYHSKPDIARLPKCRKSTPTILLICREVYSEAVVVLRKQQVVFTHGLLRTKNVNDVISAQVLQRVGSIEINTAGHPILWRNTLYYSWTGYMTLFSDLARILSEGHSLKKLTIDLTDVKLAEHTTNCWINGIVTCDYRDHLQVAFEKLRAIRGVGCVEIKGVREDVARELKARMESKPMSFLALPGEIRNKVYHYAADLDDISTQFNETAEAMMAKKRKRTAYPARSTPTIFLLNKQITKEASTIIYSKPLNFIPPKNFRFDKDDEVPSLLKFISAKTLRKVQHLNIITAWEWVYCIESIAMALTRKHNLKTFRLALEDDLKVKFLAAGDKKYPDYELHLNVSSLTDIRGVENVVIEGDLPRVYVRSLIEIMKSKQGDKMPVLKAICGNGDVVDADDAEQ